MKFFSTILLIFMFSSHALGQEEENNRHIVISGVSKGMISLIAALTAEEILFGTITITGISGTKAATVLASGIIGTGMAFAFVSSYSITTVGLRVLDKEGKIIGGVSDGMFYLAEKYRNLIQINEY